MRWDRVEVSPTMKRKKLRTLFLAAVATLGLCRTVGSALFIDLQVANVTGPAQMYGAQNVIVTGPGARLEIDMIARIAVASNDPYNVPVLQRLSGSLLSLEAAGMTSRDPSTEPSRRRSSMASAVRMLRSARRPT